jgi:hypothetical protein
MSARTRRLVGATAASIVVVAVIIAAFSVLNPTDAADLGPPTLIPRPILTVVLLSAPGLIAAIGALRRSDVVVVIAGVSALLQSFTAFSGVTFGFILPALLLIYLGVRDAESHSAGAGRRERWAGLAVLALLVAAWSVTLTLTDTICWVASTAPDGQVVYRIVPDTGSITVGVSELGGGCDSGIPTLGGLVAGAVLLAGALAAAWFARGGASSST